MIKGQFGIAVEFVPSPFGCASGSYCLVPFPFRFVLLEFNVRYVSASFRFRFVSVSLRFSYVSVSFQFENIVKSPHDSSLTRNARGSVNIFRHFGQRVSNDQEALVRVATARGAR